MMQFTEIDSLLEIYCTALRFYRSKIEGAHSNTSNQLLLPEALPKEYCVRSNKEFRSNVFSYSKELTKPYLESLYYDNVVHLLLKLIECYDEYWRVFGMDRECEILGNDYISPLSLLAGDIWKTGWEMKIAELKEFSDINLRTDYEIGGNYKPLFSYVEQAKREFERDQIIINQNSASTPTITTPPLTDQSNKNTIYILPDAKSALIADLLPYVDHPQHESLRNLINAGTEPEQPIICQCEQVRLGEIFYERVKAKLPKDRQIQTEKTKIVKWICQHFRRIDSGQVKVPTLSVITKYLKGSGFAQYQ